MTNEKLSLTLSLKEVKESKSLSEDDYIELEAKMFGVWLLGEIGKWRQKRNKH